VAEAELGEVLPAHATPPAKDDDAPSDTLTPPPEHDTIAPPAPPTHDDLEEIGVEPREGDRRP
jgi:hypothetical protein